VAAPPEAHLSGSNRRDAAWLGAMAAVGAAWVAVSALLGSITGRHQVDGIVGIILGLYVSSFPARHFVDMLIYWKTEGARFPTRRSLGWWIALNGGVLLVGFLTIVVASATMSPTPGSR
jgi:membrane protease YdiL (CAAX protease family)